MAHIHSTIHSEANDSLSTTNPEHAAHHLVTPVQYLMVYATLLLFTALTVVFAFIDLKWANPVIAVGIACFKACLVVLFFMHAKYQSRLIKMTIFSGCFIFIVLVTMTMTDYMSRAWGRW